jgi:VCBS repeat-containing protein
MKPFIKKTLFILVSLITTLFSEDITADSAILNNGTIKIKGDDGSINTLGNLRQPFYYDNNLSAWKKLTYSTYPLDLAIGIDGDGASTWNLNGTTLGSNGTNLYTLSSQSIDKSNFIVTSGNEGYGTIISTNSLVVAGKTLQLQNTYELLQDSNYIKMTFKLTNSSGSSISNIRVWVGTRDDWIADDDSPDKYKGNFDNGSFVQISSVDERASVVKIESATSGVMFFSTHSSANAILSNCCSFDNLINQDPYASDISKIDGDSSYGMFFRLSDMANGASEEITIFYAAGEIAELGNIAQEVSSAALTALEKSTNEDETLTFADLDFKDSDNNSISKIKITSLPSSGTLKVSGTDVTLNQEILLADYSNFTYTPNQDFNGHDSFNWQGYIDDAYGTDTPVNITVSPINDASTITIDTTLTVNEDVSSNLEFSYSDIDSDIVTATQKTPPTYGVISIVGTTITYTPDANYNGTDTFTLTLTDGNGFTTDKTINVTVSSVNDNPIDIILDNSSLSENASIGTTIGTLSSIDIDIGDMATFSLDCTTAGTNDNNFIIDGTTLKSNYIFDYESTAIQEICIRATDSQNGIFDKNIIINIINEDDAPLANSMAATVGPNSQTTFNNFLPSFTDVDGDNPIALKIESLPTVGSFELTDDNGLTWTKITTVPFEINMTDLANYRFNAGDNSGQNSDVNWSIKTTTLWSNTATGVVTIIDSDSNSAPDVNISMNGSDISNTVVTIDEETTTDLIYITFSDDYTPSEFLVGVVSSSDSSKVSLSDGDFNISRLDDSTVSVTITPKVNVTGDINITLGAFDGDKNGTKSFILRVNNINDEPTITIDNTLTTNEDNTQNLIFSYTDVDGDSVETIQKTAPTYGTISIVGTTITYTPSANYNGEDSFEITITDGSGFTIDKTINVTVSAVNDAPTISGTPSTTVTENSVYGFIPTANDIDTADSLTFSITNKPSWATFDTTTGELSGIPTSSSDIGTYSNIIITVTDSLSASNSLPPFTLEVEPLPPKVITMPSGSSLIIPESGYICADIINIEVGASFSSFEDSFCNTPSGGVIDIKYTPTISGIPSTIVYEDSAYNFIPTATDANSTDTLIFTITNKPSWANFDMVTGALTGTPLNKDIGVYNNIVITVTDSSNLSSSLTPFNLEVINVNDIPIITMDSTLILNEDGSKDLTFTFTDEDSNIVTATQKTSPVYGTVSIVGTTITYIPEANYNGIDIFTLTLTDGNGFTTDKTISVTVSAINDIAIVVSQEVSINENEAYTFNQSQFKAGFTDIDGDILLSIKVTKLPEYGILKLNDIDIAVGQEITVDELDSLIYYPEENFNGSVFFSGLAYDGTAYSSEASMSINVVSVNHTPLISGIVNRVVEEDSEYSFTPIASDIDVGDSLSFTITNRPSWATFDTTTGTLSGTPLNEDVGTYENITITVFDSLNASNSLEPFNIEVLNVNDAPTISINDNIIINEDISQSISFIIEDVDKGDTLLTSIELEPNYGVLLLNSSSIEYTPNPNYYGKDKFTIKVRDDSGASIEKTINIIVNDVNDKPAISSSLFTTIEKEDNYTYKISVENDIEGQVTALRVSDGVDLPEWLTLKYIQPKSIETIAGVLRESGSSGDGGDATSATLNTPSAVILNSNGEIFIADTLNHSIRKVDLDGVITTVAGTLGVSGSSGDGGDATSATLNRPYGIAFDSSNNLYIADTLNHSVRKVDSNGVITTVAGTLGVSGSSGDGGDAINAKLNRPYGLTIDKDGTILIADTFNSTLRRVSLDGKITTVAGVLGISGNSGDGGNATDAILTYPTKVAVDENGNIYIQDSGTNLIKRVDVANKIYTLTHNIIDEENFPDSIKIGKTFGITIDSEGYIYIADSMDHVIKKMSQGYVALAGNPTIDNIGNYQIALDIFDGVDISSHELNLNVTDTNITMRLRSISEDLTFLAVDTEAMTIKKGWNLISANLDRESLPKEIITLWKYQNGNWILYNSTMGINNIKSIDNQDGIWVYAERDFELTKLRNSEDIETIYGEGWSLAGTNYGINVDMIECKYNLIKSIFTYNNDKWYIFSENRIYDLEYIDKNTGFWVNCR